ncbi:MAG TPA: hypothetical protein PLZ52_08455 [Bacteroidales bacterium]|nr:hypothetical protein [Bacteroidales bacterium]
MKIPTFVTLALLFIGELASGQKLLPGKLTYCSGETKDAFIEIPYICNAKKIRFKETENSDLLVVSSSELQSISVLSTTGEQYVFEYVLIRNLLTKKAKKRFWSFVLVSGINTLYIVPWFYDINKQGEIVFIVQTMNGIEDFGFYLKKQNSDVAEYFCHGPIPGNTDLHRIHDGVFVKECNRMLADCPELVSRIKNYELRYEKMLEVIRQYNLCTSLPNQ